MRPSENKSLHTWIVKQKFLEEGILSNERIQLLNDVEFVWDQQEGLGKKLF